MSGTASAASVVNTGRLSSGSLMAWPFDKPSDVSRLFSDGAVFVTGDEPAKGWNPALSMVESSVNDDGTAFLSFTCSCGGLYRPMSCRIESSDGYTVVESPGFASFVVDNAHVMDAGSQSHGGDSFALSPMCIVQDYGLVDSFSIWNSDDGKFPESQWSGISGDVSFAAGHNISLSESDTANGFLISAEPGEGLGVVKCSDECGKLGVSDAGRLKPDDTGGIVIKGDGCVSVDTIGNMIRIDGRCPACCPMDKCRDKAGELSNLSGYVSSSFDELSSVGDDLADEIETRNTDLRNASASDLTARVTVAVSPETRALSGTGISGSRVFATMNAVFRNWSSACLVEARVTSARIEGGASFRAVSTTVDDKNGVRTVGDPVGVQVELDPSVNGGTACVSVSYRVSGYVVAYANKKHRAVVGVMFSWVNTGRDGSQSPMSVYREASTEF